MHFQVVFNSALIHPLRDSMTGLSVGVAALDIERVIEYALCAFSNFLDPYTMP